ncbi:hypothetical protein J2X43_005828 [Rhizobium sp. BE258]|nr:hypothetical protein [Rhizobium sp. BE258]
MRKRADVSCLISMEDLADFGRYVARLHPSPCQVLLPDDLAAVVGDERSTLFG